MWQRLGKHKQLALRCRLRLDDLADAGGGSGPDDDAEDHGNTAEHMDQEGNHTSKCNDPKPSEGSKRKRHDSDAGGVGSQLLTA